MRITPVNNINTNAKTFNSQKQATPSFTGKEKLFNRLYDAVGLTELIARGAAKLAQTKTSDKLIENAQTWKHTSARWCDLENAAITFFYMYNTARSKDIDEERKLPSMIQNAAVSIAATIASASVDSLFDPLIEKTAFEYQSLPKEAVQNLKNNSKHGIIKSVKDYHGAIRKLKSNTIFTAVVRFIVPVIMVPAVGTLVAKLKEYRNKKMGITEEDNKQIQNIQKQILNYQQANPLNPIGALQNRTGSLLPSTQNNDNKFKAMYA